MTRRCPDCFQSDKLHADAVCTVELGAGTSATIVSSADVDSDAAAWCLHCGWQGCVYDTQVDDEGDA